MSDEEQIEENIRKYIKGHSTTIKAYTQEYVDKKDKEIKILKSRLEEYQEYVEINHKEIEQLNNIINNIIVELEILLQSEDFELITMQLRNIVFRLKGVDKE